MAEFVFATTIPLKHVSSYNKTNKQKEKNNNIEHNKEKKISPVVRLDKVKTKPKKPNLKCGFWGCVSECGVVIRQTKLVYPVKHSVI